VFGKWLLRHGSPNAKTWNYEGVTRIHHGFLPGTLKIIDWTAYRHKYVENQNKEEFDSKMKKRLP